MIAKRIGGKFLPKNVITLASFFCHREVEDASDTLLYQLKLMGNLNRLSSAGTYQAFFDLPVRRLGAKIMRRGMELILRPFLETNSNGLICQSG